MTKIDFKKEFKELYQPSAKEFQVVEVPSMQYLMLDGRGDPNTAQEYQDAIEALYAAAYKLKFMSKKTLGTDYVVPPPEGLWGSPEMVFSLAGITDEKEWLERFKASDRVSWQWTMMIMQPDWITQEMFLETCEQVRQGKNPAALDKIRLESYHEGLSAQILHLGPYSEEGPVLAKLHIQFLPQNGYVEAGKHHEIYLSDPRKTASEKLKTILRQPIRKAK
ncbi:MAG: hypothetical protein A2Z14_05585 [Chloroflexi bacterium RBG_16_48_8]|nr:MAG: hypothetical protein A2Z14_05585 [Chloroflexi bacterium RBG_16_48_8]